MPRMLLRPGWVATHLVVLALAVLLVNLGLWQLDRHAEVQAANARIVAAADRPPLPLDEALAADPVDHQPATATGTYDRDADVELSPRSSNDRPGFEVLTPLRLDDGRALLVNRGWVPLGEQAPPPPTGRVTVTGRLEPPAAARQVLPPDEPVAEVVSNPDTRRLAQQVDDLILSAHLVRVDDAARTAGTLPRPAGPLQPDAGNHLSYALQWFAFAVIGLVGYPLLLRRRLADARQQGGAAPRRDRSPDAGPPGHVEPDRVAQ